MWPVLLAFLVLPFAGHSFLPWFFILYFSHNLPNWSSPPFSRTTFQNFHGIYDLLFYVSNFYHHTNLCSKCCISLNSSLSPICWPKGSLLVFYKYMYICMYYRFRSWKRANHNNIKVNLKILTSGLDLFASVQRPIPSFCENGNELWDSTKCRTFLK